jgi:aminopeptidase N
VTLSGAGAKEMGNPDKETPDVGLPRSAFLGAKAGAMCTLAALCGLVVAPLGAVTPGHRLPSGPERPVRERTVDIQHLTADLRFDMDRQTISGEATVRLAPLRSGLDEVSLDAAGLEIRQVQMLVEVRGFESGSAGTSAFDLAHAVEGRQLVIELPDGMPAGNTLTLRIAYAAAPKAGMYFFPATERRAAQVWNYGEGGLHYGWLPLYNDTNDRFAVDLRVTVDRPYVALGNGTLTETRDNPDGSRTFHWVQEEEIPNYLLALDVGEFVEVPLRPATVGDRQVPLSVWTAPGEEEAVAHTFGETPRMMEFFSRRFGYPYVWPKYDQVTLREFDWAMETATMVGFSETYERREGDPVDSQPSFDQAWPSWTTSDTIAHELAHHWFGDLVTCRSLGSLWLNESFATFSHTIWNGEARGEDDLTYQRWRFLDSYLDHVRETGEVRPLEYQRYEAPGDMFQEETTYLKGALVLHMLRRIVGDDGFYGTLSSYLKRHAFSEVTATDLQAEMERRTGHNLSRFFEDWIVGGGGHPALQVSYRWAPDRRQVDLTVKQVQTDLPFENLFRLPVEVEVITAEGAASHTVELDDWTTRVSLPAASRPLAVVFDKGNWLVAELAVERSLEEVLYLLGNGDLAARLQAARQLATDFPRRPPAAAALGRLLADAEAHWGLRQEAARDLGTIGGEVAREALIGAAQDPDRRLRRAVAVALAEIPGDEVAATLRALVEGDEAEDVAAAAAFSLGRMRAPGAADFLRRQLGRESRWAHAIQLGALLGLAELENPSLVPTFAAYVGPAYPSPVRLAALDGWFAAARDLPALAARLSELTADGNLAVQGAAIDKLGQLHRAADLPLLERLAADELNENLARTARDAAELIRAFN